MGKHLDPGSKLLDLGTENPFTPQLKAAGYSVSNTQGENLDDDFKKIAKATSDLEDLNLFIDDNPTERELVKQILPDVTTPDFPIQPYDLPNFSTKLVPAGLNPNTYLPYAIPGIEIVLTIIFITIVGGLSLSFLCKKFLQLIDVLFKRIPILSTLYSAIGQMTVSFINHK